MHTACVPGAHRGQRTEVTNGCEQKMNAGFRTPGPLQEHQVFLTIFFLSLFFFETDFSVVVLVVLKLTV